MVRVFNPAPGCCATWAPVRTYWCFSLRCLAEGSRIFFWRLIRVHREHKTPPHLFLTTTVLRMPNHTSVHTSRPGRLDVWTQRLLSLLLLLVFNQLRRDLYKDRAGW